jgi:hypothetical protein
MIHPVDNGSFAEEFLHGITNKLTRMDIGIFQNVLIHQ